MTESGGKLTVRIKLPDKVEAGGENASEEGPLTGGQVTYRWDRIIGVALVIIIIGTLAFRLLSPDSPTEIRRTPSGEQASSTGTRNAISAEQEVIASAHEAPARVENPAESITGSVPDIRESGVPVQGEEQPGEPAAMDPADQEGVAVQDPGEDNPDSEVGPIAGESEESPELISVSEAASKPTLSAGETRILSQQVQRFLLTKGIRSREPVGTIADISVQDASTGLVPVYAFSDVRGLGGRTLYYRWLKDEKLIASVRIAVGSDRWRSHSSKILNNRLKGAWRVELKTSDGNLLAFTEFVY